MALPPTLDHSLTPQELTFITEEEQIEIVPSFSMSKIRLVSGIYGPFNPPNRTTVPLWLALSLKRKKKCRIIPPDWLNPEILSAMVQEEMNEPNGLWPDIPRCLFETAKVLLDVAPNDLTDPASIRSTIQSLRHLRLAKIRTALRPPPPTNTSSTNTSAHGNANGAEGDPDTGAFSGRGEYMSLTGFTPFEAGQMRGMFGAVLGVVGRLSGGGAGGGEGEGMDVDR